MGRVGQMIPEESVLITHWLGVWGSCRQPFLSAILLGIPCNLLSQLGHLRVKGVLLIIILGQKT